MRASPRFLLIGIALPIGFFALLYGDHIFEGNYYFSGHLCLVVVPATLLGFGWASLATFTSRIRGHRIGGRIGLTVAASVTWFLPALGIAIWLYSEAGGPL